MWAFLSEQARVIFFGVHKDEATLAQILDPLVFQGLVVSENAAVYANFTHSQKCRAHLLRKAIKLTLAVTLGESPKFTPPRCALNNTIRLTIGSYRSIHRLSTEIILCNIRAKPITSAPTSSRID